MTATSTGLVLAETVLPGPAFAELEPLEIAVGSIARHVTSVRPDVEAIISAGGRVDDRLLDLLPALRVVARFGVGYEKVDVEACSARGIQVSITPGPVETATAELTVALMLASRRSLVAGHETVREGGWSPPVSVLPGDDGLHGATVGLIGFGRIGQAVAALVEPFGSRVLCTSRSRRAGEPRWTDLETLLRESDIVSVHFPLSPETEGLIGRRELALMRDGALFVNTARGTVVDSEALLDELESGRLRAALDVFEGEPHVAEPFRRLPNVVLSPHAGSATRQARVEMTRVCVANVQAALAGGRVPNPVRD